MCGVLGFIQKIKASDADKILLSMAKEISHRGPDNTGIWYDPEYGVALGHNRLSILDLSESANQPMQSASGRLRIVFNGEIYNHLKIRNDLGLEGYNSWRGHSDTETILVAIECWGIERAVKKFTGMFSFVIWDNYKKELFLVRDRMGEKPLYYGWINNVFLFSSELKALKKHNSFTPEIDKKSLGLYLKLLSVPAPYSIYKNILKVEPGMIVKVKKDRTYEKIRYWDYPCQKESLTINSFNKSFQEAQIDLTDLLTNVVSDQMVADVPVGAFLSGGIDSSLIVALMQNISSNRVHTYSISFDDERYDESDYAYSVAKYLNTRHFTKRVSSNNLLETVEKLSDIYDEPFSDSSQIPTYLVSEFASNDVKVVLTGDGADEVFGGYNRHVLVDQFWQQFKSLPIFIKKISATMGSSLSEKNWDHINNVLKRRISSYNFEMLGNKIYKALKFIESKDDIDLYESLVFIERDTQSVLIESSEYDFFEDYYGIIPDYLDAAQKIMHLDQMISLSSQILVKVDRATMANSLESRIPFLNHDVVDFAASLPLDYMVDNGIGKKILREILFERVPRELFQRPKRGFGVPIDEWLRHDLRSWSEDLISEKKIMQQENFNYKYIERIWREHQSGKRNHANCLWSILMFQSWVESLQ